MVSSRLTQRYFCTVTHAVGEIDIQCTLSGMYGITTNMLNCTKLRQGCMFIITNTLNCCFPHMNRYWHKQSLTHRASSNSRAA